MSSKHFRQVRGPAQKPPRPLSPVSYATPDDLDALIEFLVAVKDELGGVSVDGDLLAELAHDLTHRVRGIALIVKSAGIIEASLGLRAESPLLSRMHHLRSTWYVVAPECRSTGHAKSLLIKGLEFADTLGRPLLIEELTPDVASGKVALIGRHFKTAGAVFLHRPVTAAA